MFKNLFKPQNLGNLKVMITATLFAAISIVCGKFLAFNVGDVLRFSFENLPIILSGIVFGPLVGTVTGLLADVIGCLLRGYALNPILTLAAVFIGFAAGLVFNMLKKCNITLKTLIAVLICHAIGSVVIKSIGLSIWYSLPLNVTLIERTINYLIVGATEFVFLILILKNKSFYKQITRMTGVKNEL